MKQNEKTVDTIHDHCVHCLFGWWNTHRMRPSKLRTVLYKIKYDADKYQLSDELYNYLKGCRNEDIFQRKVVAYIENKEFSIKDVQTEMTEHIIEKCKLKGDWSLNEYAKFKLMVETFAGTKEINDLLKTSESMIMDICDKS